MGMADFGISQNKVLKIRSKKKRSKFIERFTVLMWREVRWWVILIFRFLLHYILHTIKHFYTHISKAHTFILLKSWISKNGCREDFGIILKQMLVVIKPNTQTFISATAH